MRNSRLYEYKEDMKDEVKIGKNSEQKVVKDIKEGKIQRRKEGNEGTVIRKELLNGK